MDDDELTMKSYRLQEYLEIQRNFNYEAFKEAMDATGFSELVELMENGLPEEKSDKQENKERKSK